MFEERSEGMIKWWCTFLVLIVALRVKTEKSEATFVELNINEWEVL